jgi:drug/metabolite transporter (DMT)-like permease
MMVPVLALLIDAIYFDIKFSYYDLIALLMIIMSIFIAAKNLLIKKIYNNWIEYV